MKNIIKNFSKFITFRMFYLILGMLVSLFIVTTGVYLVQAVTGEAPNLIPADSWDTVNDGVNPDEFLTDELWNGLVNKVGELELASGGGWAYDSGWVSITVNSGGARGTGFYNNRDVNEFSHGLGSAITDVVALCKSHSYDKTKVISGQMGNFVPDNAYNSVEWDSNRVYVFLEENIIFHYDQIYNHFEFDACGELRVLAR